MQKIRVRCRKGDTVLYIKMLKWRTFEMQELKDAEKQIHLNTCKAEFAKQYTLFSFFLKKVLLNISLLVNEGKFFPENIMQ